MKKALTIIEVLISTLLITLVIGSLLQIKENSLFIIEKSTNKNFYQSLISFHALDYDMDNVNGKTTINSDFDKYNLTDSKRIKYINIENRLSNKIEDKSIFNFSVLENSYKLDNNYSSKFYIIKEIR